MSKWGRRSADDSKLLFCTLQGIFTLQPCPNAFWTTKLYEGFLILDDMISPRWISDSSCVTIVTWICLVMQHVYRSQRSSDHWLFKDGAFSSDSQSWRSLQTEHIKHINLLTSSLRGERQDLSIALKTEPKRAWEKKKSQDKKIMLKIALITITILGYTHASPPIKGTSKHNS